LIYDFENHGAVYLQGLGDMNHDGVPDFLTVNVLGVVQVYAGATGGLYAEASPGSPSCQGFIGPFAARLRDYDGDGLPDLMLLGQPNTYHIATSTVPYALDYTADFCAFGRFDTCRCNLGPSGDGQTERPAVIDDVDHDGYPDVAIAIPDPGTVNPSRIRIVSGNPAKNFRLILEQTFSTPGTQLGAVNRAMPDMDYDNVGDFILGAPGTPTGYVELFSGATGDPIYRITASPNDTGFGSATTSISDVNHDGRADILISSSNSNKVYLYAGPQGSDLMDTCDYFQIGATTVCM
jgi:hypothetical protein